MRCVFLMFGSLNRSAIGPYRGTAIPTPNFDRLAEHSVRFDNHYVGSMPCMPDRRDLHTGRLNFLHRSWGPLEPFDKSFVNLLGQQDIWTHLISDHFHYFYEGGSTYHTQYSSWEFVRGQEADRWKAMAQPPIENFRKSYHPCQTDTADDRYLPYMINREFIRDESDFPLVKCIESGLDFLERHQEKEDWFLQIECFDPHEPFFAPPRFREQFPTDYSGPILDWPRYKRLDETAEEIAELRANYAALVAMCDEYLGRLLDYFDANDLWKDTVLIVTTDHGYLLGEHDWWAKNRMPFYNEIAHIPLFVAHPDAPGGSSRQALTQTMDLMPTFLELFGQETPGSVEGKSLVPLIQQDGPGHEAILYGIFGGATNITDGRYTYFNYPADVFNQDIWEYTLMPLHQRMAFTAENLRNATLVPGFDFTDGIPLLRIPARRSADGRIAGMGLLEDYDSALYDLKTDPGQEHPLDNPAIQSRLEGQMRQLMQRNDAPPEAFSRLDLAG